MRYEGWHWKAKGKDPGETCDEWNWHYDCSQVLQKWTSLESAVSALLNKIANTTACPKGPFVNEEANVCMC